MINHYCSKFCYCDFFVCYMKELAVFIFSAWIGANLRSFTWRCVNSSPVSTKLYHKEFIYTTPKAEIALSTPVCSHCLFPELKKLSN